MEVKFELPSSNCNLEFECADITAQEMVDRLRLFADILEFSMGAELGNGKYNLSAEGDTGWLLVKLRWEEWPDESGDGNAYDGNIVYERSYMDGSDGGHTFYSVHKAFFDLLRKGRTFGEVGQILCIGVDDSDAE